MAISISDAVSLLALALSVYATVQTVRFNEKQKKMIDSQEKLNNVLLKKEESESFEGKKAEISASIISIGSNKKRLKIANIGKSTARNIKIIFPEGDDFVIEGDVNSKFPLESLDRFGSVELYVAQYIGSKSKNVIIVQWDDDYKNNREKTFHLTL